LQDAIELFQDKKYKKAYKEFEKSLEQSINKSEVYNYLFLCSKYLGENININFKNLIKALFDEKKFFQLNEIVERTGIELKKNENILYIKSLLESGDIEKAKEKYLESLSFYISHKNYMALKSLLEFEKEMFIYHPKLELIKLMMWVDLCDYESLMIFLQEYEKNFKKHWKVFRNLKIDSDDFTMKVLEIIEGVVENSAALNIEYNFLKVKMNKKISDQEALEQLILNINDPVKQSYLYKVLGDEKELLREYISTCDVTDRNLLYKETTSKITKPQKSYANEYNETEEFKLHFDRIKEETNEEFKISYEVTQAEKDLLRLINKSEEFSQNPEQYINIFIENSFLKAAYRCTEFLPNNDINNYYKAEILFRLKEWHSLIDICFKVYDEIGEDKKIIWNYFLGVAYLEVKNPELALKYLNKVMLEDPTYRQVREKVELAQN
jgi:hypothetical protein